ncbi:S-adenosyl-L-methionine-dependent methyltransferase, partial [Talaromyces proteolyticus]
STTTVDNNVYQYPFENDRRYHAYCEVKYPFVALETDADRRNCKELHYFFRFTMRDSLHHAPLSNPQKILDVGTGTGIWAMEMADLYPSAEVIGADLSPIQPLWVPPNLQFLVADAEDLTLFGENKFDFIYIRCFAGCASNWNTFLERAFSLLRPGGFIECVEVEFDVRYERQSRNLDNDTHLTQFLRLIHEAAEKRNRTLNVASKLKCHLQATGFRDIKETVYNIPLHKESLDPRELQIGHDSLRCATNSIEAYGIRLFTRELKWSRIEALVLFAEVRNELRNSERQQFRPYTRL